MSVWQCKVTEYGGSSEQETRVNKVDEESLEGSAGRRKTAWKRSLGKLLSVPYAKTEQ